MAKDSGNTVQDATVMLAIYNPFRDGLKTYHDYNINILQGYFRSIMILKNRFGDCDAEVGCNFFGGINYFKELEKPDEIYDYNKYLTPDYLINSKETKQDDTNANNLDNPTNSNLNFVL